MNICFSGLKSGSFCLADATTRLQETGTLTNYAGLGILAVAGLAIVVILLRKPT